MVRHRVRLAHLLEGLPYRCLCGSTELEVEAVCDDSRHCRPGSLFVAVRGHVHDGHRFIPEALQRGARGILCEDPPTELPEGCTVVQTPNTRTALVVVAHRFYGEPSRALRLIGVTGTNGKTTTTFLVRQVLEYAGIPTGVIGTTGAYYGTEHRQLQHTTPTPIELCSLLAWMRQQGAQAVAAEVSSHALDQHRVDALHFAAALFTNLSHDHLDYHGTMEAYALAKQRLFRLLPQEGLAIACECGDGWGRFMLSAAGCRHRYWVGTSPEADFELRQLCADRTGIRWEMRFPGSAAWVPFQGRLLGEYNVFNAALAVALGWSWGIEPQRLQEAIAEAEPPPGRMEPVALPNGALALVDYAHTPDALEHALKAARQLLPQGARLICVFGCGGERDRAKRPQMGAIAARWADSIVLTNDNPRREPPEQILQDILSGIPADAAHRVVVLPDRREALQTAVQMSTAGDILVVAGKGHEEYQILGEHIVPLSDREILRTIARRMSEGMSELGLVQQCDVLSFGSSGQASASRTEA